MATGQNRFQSATKILAALERFRPGNESLAVAKVVLMISMHEFGLAVEFIDEVALVAHPGSAMLLAFRGMALMRMDRREEATGSLLVAAAATDVAAANLAKGLLAS